MEPDKHLTGGDGTGSGLGSGSRWNHRGGQQESPSEHRNLRFSAFEQDCLDELDLDSDEASSTGTRSDGGTGNPKDDFLDSYGSEQSSHRLWLAFQHTASSISQLYRDHCAAPGAGSPWYSFQTAAGACTDMYKESQDVLKICTEEARKEGRKQLIKEIVMWLKKRGRRGRHVRREDLLAFLTGKPPPPHSRPMTTVASGLGASGGGPGVAGALGSSPHQRRGGALLNCHGETTPGSTHRRGVAFADAYPHRIHSDYGSQDGTNNNNNAVSGASLFLEPDLKTFRDALAVQGLSGALSNIRVAGSPHSNVGGCSSSPVVSSFGGGASPLRQTPPLDRVRSNSSSSRFSGGRPPQEDLHQFISDHMTLHGTVGGAGVDEAFWSGPTSPQHRKRSASQSAAHHPHQHHSLGDGGQEVSFQAAEESPSRKRHRLA